MKKKLNELLRKYVAKRAIGNLGSVEILDNEIICYVDGRKLKKKEKKLYRYNFMFRNIPSSSELYRMYRVDKPIHYIVKDVEFDREVNIMASMNDCHVTFENCTFTSYIGIDFADYITFINNRYKSCSYKNYRSLVPEGHFYISTKRDINEINKIEFLCDRVDVKDILTIPMVKTTDAGKKLIPEKTKKSISELWLHAKEIDLINTDIVNTESIELCAENLYINRTNINSNEVTIEVNNIESCYSNMNGGIVVIDTVDDISRLIKGKLNLIFNTIYINGVKAKNNIVSVHDVDLQIKRLELINSLKKVKLSCEDVISEKIKKQPLTKVLKINKGR